ncbi:hypothetical protein N7495_008958 [Penicillium taxi]|uniref:uncharacterized protein n=1 Tax=Penicillium taxi TaxID=168475 RepID=UPI002545136C|nr:uncharacterized protein N7495_008958 [Penicillium taxi]KAJ5888917.1 hypothetical protein N7495_008958 [Penicillium taxi]
MASSAISSFLFPTCAIMQSQALAKRPDGQLMPPPPLPKRIKRPAIALDEDVYTEALSQIIARDFFPGLRENKAKQEYLNALDSNDKEWIHTSRKALLEVLNPRSCAQNRSSIPGTPQHGSAEQTPRGWGGDTPMSVVSAASLGSYEKGLKVPDVSKMSLSAFQSTYTSEDNESFNKVLDKQNTKRREKSAWIWNENKLPSKRQIAQSKVERITSSGDNTTLITTDLDARPAMPDSWKYQPKNTIMFQPSGIEDTHETLAQKRESESRAAPMQTVYRNTRLMDAASSAAESVPESPSMSAIDDAIIGNPRFRASEGPRSPKYTVMDGARATAVQLGETPRVNGYAFVDEFDPEPTPRPQTRGKEREASPTTKLDWSILGPSSATPNPFKLGETGRREALHHRIVDRSARRTRVEKAARNAKTPASAIPHFSRTPGLTPARTHTPSPHEQMLTPAAQRLLSSFGGNSPRPSGPAWTPIKKLHYTPKQTPKMTPKGK